MIRSAASKVMWVGRATVFLVGLAVMVALVLGVATSALGAAGESFILGQANSAGNKMSSLSSSVADALKSTLLLRNTGGTSALELKVGNANVPANDVAPMKVNSSAKVANLNADTLDGLDSSQLAAANAVKVGHLRLTQPATDGQINSGTVFETNAFRIEGYCLNSFVSGSPHAGLRVVAKQNNTTIIYTTEGTSTPGERLDLAAGQFVEIAQIGSSGDLSSDSLQSYGTYVADAPGGSNTPPSLLEGQGTSSTAGFVCRFAATGLGE